MKDERWKMICEWHGLDYDDIVADMPAERERFTMLEETNDVKVEDCKDASVENCGGVRKFPLVMHMSPRMMKRHALTVC